MAGGGRKGRGGGYRKQGKHLPPILTVFDVFQEKKKLETFLVFHERSRVC